MTKTLLAIVAGLAFMALTVLLAPPTLAHTAMLRASPDRDAIVGGSVGFIDLLFLDAVTDATAFVSYNGAPLTGQTTVTAGEVITFALEQPLAQPGRYQVNYEMISPDGDFTTGGYFFTFDPAAGPAARIEPPEPGGLSTTLALSVGGITVLAGLLGLFLWRTGSQRRQQVGEVADGHGAADYY